VNDDLMAKSASLTPKIEKASEALTQNAALYLQVEATLKEMIEGLSYSPGDQIPSERELSEQLGVSRMTVRRAIENLIRRGLLERRSTSGTFVRQPQVYRRVGKDVAVGITQLLREEGAVAGSKLLCFETLLAPLKIAEKLKLRLGVPVVMIRRLRTANGKPFCVETSYLSAEIVPGLSAEDLMGESASLYRILAERYGIRLSQNYETLDLSYATHEEAQLLELKEGDPVLLLRSVVMDELDRPVEYLKSVNHPKRVVFHSRSTFYP
jgi:GntR family transcriptional regulator